MRERLAAAGGRGAGTGRAWKQDEWAVAPQQIRACSGTRESGFGEGKGSYWMIFELESRDFMHFMALKHGADLFAIPAADALTVMMSMMVSVFNRTCMCLWGWIFLVFCALLALALCHTRARIASAADNTLRILVHLIVSVNTHTHTHTHTLGGD
jgi:hypothetical protein